MKSLERWLAYATIFALYATVLSQGNQVETAFELAGKFKSMNFEFIDLLERCKTDLAFANRPTHTLFEIDKEGNVWYCDPMTEHCSNLNNDGGEVVYE